MNLVEEVLNQPELIESPPVLVDIGAAGGVHAPWRPIARYAIGVGFEPDKRDAGALSDAQRLFRKWVFVPGLAVPQTPADGVLPFHLTRSPQCSSVLPPDVAGLAPWAFSGLFEVVDHRPVAAVGLYDGLHAQGIERVDWLKCDTQGMDLRLYLSLPEGWRRKMLSLEMEPGFIDAYRGEDGISAVLHTMKDEPFWLSQCEVQCTPRGRAAELRAVLGASRAGRYVFFGAGAPGWANLTYLRDFENRGEVLDRREHLLGWCFATLAGQPAAALGIARLGQGRFGGTLFTRLEVQSQRAMKRALWCRWFRSLPRRLLRR